MDETELLERAQTVLKNNDRGGWTAPADGLYPHQWLWDSCFTAIGLRHLDIERAQTELRYLLRSQWANGMLPHMIFNPEAEDKNARRREQTHLNPNAPDGINTSGITQPPMLAEAVLKVGQKLKTPERRSWYKETLPHLMDYHSWLYGERDGGQGLVVAVHPYEIGLDNSPPFSLELHRHAWPWWLHFLKWTGIDKLITLLRRDTRYVPANQRADSLEGVADMALLRRLRQQLYDSHKILKHPKFAVEDLAFNSILVRANKHLVDIAKTAGQELPENLLDNMRRTAEALEQLWDEADGQYYSRSFISHELIKQPSIATLLPLYAGIISQARAAELVKLLKDSKTFGTSWPVPSVPVGSPYFKPYKYWQGPTWLNTNWLIIEGLRGYGYEAEANLLRERTLQMVNKSGIYEYYNPLNGYPAGAPDFSWTAALTIELLKS